MNNILMLLQLIFRLIVITRIIVNPNCAVLTGYSYNMPTLIELTTVCSESFILIRACVVLVPFFDHPNVPNLDYTVGVARAQ